MYLNFPQILNLLGYDCKYDETKMQMFSDSPVPDSTIVLKNDTLWLGSKEICSGDYIPYNNKEPYIKLECLALLLSCNIKEYFNSLAVHFYTVQPFPVTVNEQVRALRQRLSEKNKRLMFPDLDSVKKKIFRIHSLGYSFSEQNSSNSPLSFNLLLGTTGELFKGTFRAQYIYNENDYLNKNNGLFWWNRRFKKNFLKEISVFRTNSYLQMYAGRYITGVTLSNRSLEYFNYRDYKFSEVEMPDTDFDVYCNGRFIDRVRSASDGKIEMNIPIGDGKNIIKLVHYDIYGRVYNNEYNVYMPYQFQPGKKFSYTFSAGYGDLGCGFINAQMYYGINHYITIGAYSEAIIDVGNSRAIIEGSIKWSPKYIFRVEANYMPGVRASIAASLYLNRFGMNLYYQRYERNQTKIPFAPLEKTSLSTSYSFDIKTIRTSFSFVAQNYRMNSYSNIYATLRSLLSYRKWSANLYLSATSQYYAGSTGFSYGASVSYIPNGKLNQELGFDCSGSRQGGLIRSRTQYVFKDKLFCFTDINYGFKNQRFSISLGVTYKLPYAQFQSSFNTGNGYYSLANTVSGALQFIDKGHIVLSDRIAPSGSTLLIKPFIDKNGNGEYDKGEVVKSNINISTQYSSNIVHTSNGIYLRNLPVDSPFKIVIPAQPMEDITQQLRGVEYSFLLSNYQSKVLYVPIDILSDIYGYVYLVDNGKKTVLSGIPLRIYKEEKIIKTLRTDGWGTFSYTELKPGKYEIKIPEEFLEQNGYRVIGDNSIKIETGYNGEGVQIDKLDIKLTRPLD